MRIAATLDLDDDADPGPVGLVAQVADGLDLLGAHQLGDALEQRGLVDLEGDLGDHDRHAARPNLLDVRLGAHEHPAAPRGVGALDALVAHDRRAGREVRAGDEPPQLVGRHRVDRLPPVDQVHQRVADLAEVVRRDVGGHAHRDAGGAVDQQVGHPGRQHHRLLARVIEVRPGIDRVHVDVGQKLDGHARGARLGVAVGSRRVAVDRSEVALAVDEQIAHREVLGHAHHGVVDRRVAMRMVLAEHVTDRGGALLVGPVGAQTGVVHGVQDAPLHRLEPIARVGQRARRDHAHRVIEEGLAHLVLDVDELDRGALVHGLLAVAGVGSTG